MTKKSTPADLFFYLAHNDFLASVMALLFHFFFVIKDFNTIVFADRHMVYFLLSTLLKSLTKK
jgi:hypothetical protein